MAEYHEKKKRGQGKSPHLPSSSSDVTDASSVSVLGRSLLCTDNASPIAGCQLSERCAAPPRKVENMNEGDKVIKPLSCVLCAVFDVRRGSCGSHLGNQFFFTALFAAF